MAPGTGEVSATLGGGFATMLTAIGCDIVMPPPLSVARADSVCVPVTAVLQVAEYGAATAVATIVPPSRNSTLVTMPSLSVAVAASAIRDPAPKLAPADGAVNDTVGAMLVTVTFTAVQVATAPRLSVAFAVRL